MEPGPGPRSAGASKGFAPLKESVSRPPAPSVQSAVKDLEPHLLVKRFRLRETDAIAHPGGHYTIRVVGPLEIPALLGLGTCRQVVSPPMWELGSASSAESVSARYGHEAKSQT